MGLAVILLLAYAPAYSQQVLVSSDARAIRYYLAEQFGIEKFTFRLMLFFAFFSLLEANSIGLLIPVSTQ